MNTVKMDVKNVKMIAHRGLSGLETENSCSAFVAAGNRASYYGIETDVHRTEDGRFVIFHDDNTERMTGQSLVIEETTYDKLKDLILHDTNGTCGRQDLRIPLLEDYIGICKKYDKECVLELKNKFTEEDILKIVKIIEDMQYLDRVIFISFQFENLSVIKNYKNQLRAQYLLKEWNEEASARLKECRMDVDIDYKALNAETVKEIHDAGMEINCWTVNTAEEAQSLIEMGVDYITTNILEAQ